MNYFSAERLGPFGLVGVGLLLCSGLADLMLVQPREAELESLVIRHERLLTELRRGQAEAGRTVAGAPGTAQIPVVLQQLHALGQSNGLMPDRTSYTLKGTDEWRRLEITAPVQGSYPALRLYLRQAMLLTRTASLDELTLQRPRADDPGVEAQVRLSYFFVPSR